MVLQGDSRPDAGWAIPLIISFFTPGADLLNEAPLYEFDLITKKSAGGDAAICEVTGAVPGTYDITVLGEHTLMNAGRNVVISAPETSVDMVMLLEGDANQDNIVDFDDYAILSKSWLVSESQPEYDIRADFDRNGLINTADLSLLASNWLSSSPVEIFP